MMRIIVMIERDQESVRTGEIMSTIENVKEVVHAHQIEESMIV